MKRDATPSEGEIVFHEEQRFRQGWILIVIAVASLALIGTATYGLVVQLGLGRPFGKEPLSNGALVALGSFMILLGVGLIWLFVSARLETWVTRAELVVRFRPFHLRPRRFALAELRDVQACRYEPLREYGGWGIRLGPSGWAYNVSGDRGVRFTTGAGKPLLVGSQKSEALAAAIARGARPR